MNADGVQDHHGNNIASATVLTLDRYGETSKVGRMDSGEDVDLFRLEIASDSQATIWTTGQLDTNGAFLAYTENGIAFATSIARGDNSGVGDNFRITTTLPPRLYYVDIDGDVEPNETEGIYTLHVNVVPIKGTPAVAVAAAALWTAGFCSCCC